MEFTTLMKSATMFSVAFLMFSQTVMGKNLSTPDDTEKVCLSYSKHISQPKANSGLGFNYAGKYAPCILINPNQGLSGSTITEIEPCLTFADMATERSGSIIIWDYESGNILYEQDCTFKFGYNKIKFKTPYKLEEKPLLIGYQVELNEGEKGLGIDPAYARCDEGCFLYSGGKRDDYSQLKGVGSWALNVWIQPGEKDLSQNVNLRAFSSDQPYVKKNGKVMTTAIIHNLSLQKINEVTCSVKGITNEGYNQKFNITLDKGQMDTIRMEIPIEYSGKMQFTLKTLNNKAVTSPSERTASILYYSKEGMPKRQHLLETFAAEWAPFMGASKNEIEDAEEFFKGTDTKYNLCEIHINDAFGTDEHDALRANAYNNLPSKKCGAPRLSLNRIPFDNNVTYSCTGKTNDRLELIDKETYSFYNFDLKLTATDNPMKLKATVNIEELEKINFDDVVVTLSLLEDSVKAIDQTNAPSDPYYHNNLLIKTINSINGTPLEFADGKFSKTFDVNIDKPLSGNLKNVKVLATIGRRPNAISSPSDKTIFDSRVVTYRDIVSTSIKTTENDMPVKVFANNGKLNVVGIYDKVEVWNAAGQIVKQAGLPRGMYIVKVSKGTHTATFKVNMN